jgi:hypothetical protein
MEVVGALCTSFPKTVKSLGRMGWQLTPVRLDECDNYLVHGTVQLRPVGDSVFGR